MTDEPPKKRSNGALMKTLRDVEEQNKFDKAKNFRLLVVLPKEGLPYKVVNTDNFYINKFYNFTLDEDVNQDFLHRHVNLKDNDKLFEWETINDETKMINLKGVIPLWSYLVVTLLQIPSKKTFPRTSTCPKRLFPDECGLVDIDSRWLKTRLRFTSVESLIAISNKSVEVQQEVGHHIGSHFDMVTLCDSEGLASEDFQSYLNYVGLYVHLHNQVSER